MIILYLNVVSGDLSFAWAHVCHYIIIFLKCLAENEVMHTLAFVAGAWYIYLLLGSIVRSGEFFSC